MSIPSNFGGGTVTLTNADGSFEVPVNPDGTIPPSGFGLDGVNIRDLEGAYQIDVAPGWTGTSEPENPSPTFTAGPDGSMGWFDANTGQKLGTGFDENQAFFMHAARQAGVDPATAYSFVRDPNNAAAVAQTAAPLIAENKRGSSTGVFNSILGGVGGMINDLPTFMKLAMAAGSMGSSLAGGAAVEGTGALASSVPPEAYWDMVAGPASKVAVNNAGFIQNTIAGMFPGIEDATLKAATNAVTSALVNAGKTAITGGDISDVLKSGAIGAISGGVGSMIPDISKTLGIQTLTKVPFIDSAIRQGVQTAAGGALSGGVGAAIRGGDIVSGIGQGALTGLEVGGIAGALGPFVGDLEKGWDKDVVRVVNAGLGGAIQGGVTGSGILTGAAGGALGAIPGPIGYVAPAVVQPKIRTADDLGISQDLFDLFEQRSPGAGTGPGARGDVYANIQPVTQVTGTIPADSNIVETRDFDEETGAPIIDPNSPDAVGLYTDNVLPNIDTTTTFQPGAIGAIPVEPEINPIPEDPPYVPPVITKPIEITIVGGGSEEPTPEVNPIPEDPPYVPPVEFVLPTPEVNPIPEDPPYVPPVTTTPLVIDIVGGGSEEPPPEVNPIPEDPPYVPPVEQPSAPTIDPFAGQSPGQGSDGVFKPLDITVIGGNPSPSLDNEQVDLRDTGNGAGEDAVVPEVNPIPEDPPYVPPGEPEVNPIPEDPPYVPPKPEPEPPVIPVVPPPIIPTDVTDLGTAGALAELIKKLLEDTKPTTETPTPETPTTPETPGLIVTNDYRPKPGAIGSLPVPNSLYQIALPQAGPINAALWNSQNVYGARQPL